MPAPLQAMTSQETAQGGFARAIQQAQPLGRRDALREIGTPTLEDALAYLDLFAEQKPEKLERAAVRWHGRLEIEMPLLTLARSRSSRWRRWRASQPASRM